MFWSDERRVRENEVNNCIDMQYTKYTDSSLVIEIEIEIGEPIFCVSKYTIFRDFSFKLLFKISKRNF